MILLTLLCLLLGSSVALPASPNLPTDIPHSFFTGSTDRFDTRSIWSIIWSCFSTIFACTWVAVHPNIPPPTDSQWAVLRRRVTIMGYIIIFPEIVIIWASRQHHAAKLFAKKHQGRGWTMAHGFFLVMGGFTLHDGRGTAVRVLEPEELETLTDAGKIAWPSITEEEIQDRSKGDYLSKGFVLVQTGWFITQCIVRGAYGLAVTELEMATIAFAVLTGATYYLWWHKPLDVRCSVPVCLLDETEIVPSTVAGSPAHNPPPVLPPIFCEPTLDLNPSHVQLPSQFPISEESRVQQRALVVSPDLEPNDRRRSSSSNNDSTGIPSQDRHMGTYFFHIRRFAAFTQRQRQKRGIFVSLLGPLLTLFAALGDAAASDTLDRSMPLCVPPFYSPKVADSELDFASFSTTMVAGYVFGGIHCVAWLFRFPSLQEKLMWRISALTVSLLIYITPIFSLFITFPPKVRRSLEAFVLPMMVTYILVYLTARITLLVLACITLRALPPKAFMEIQWTSFIPHVG